LSLFKDSIISHLHAKPSTETVVRRGLVTEKVKATDVIKSHQTYCDTEREIKHFTAGDTLAYVTPVRIV